MESQNQYFYNRPERPTPMQAQQQDQAFSMDQSKMGPMMRALTEDFDMGAQNSTPSYPQQQGVTSMPGAAEQQRMPSNNFGPASQTLSGYASQYSSAPGSSHNFFGQGHPTSPLNSGFSSPGGNYPPPGGINNPYPRQMPASSPLGSPNGHGHSYPRSNSAGPSIPSPVMMHGPGMYSHNQTSPGNRTNAPFGFPPTSPTSPHNHLNHTSPPLASPSSMRPGGNLHSPKSVPASSPVPFASQMSPPVSRAQSVPTLPGNTVDHMTPAPHSRSKSPGSAGIHRPFPQPMTQPQHLYPLPSPKVRPVDQTDGRGQYVELVHSKPSAEQWNQSDQQRNNRPRHNSGQRRVSDPGSLPRLEEMVAVLGDSNVKETLDEIVSDKNLLFSENGEPEKDSIDNVNQNSHSDNNEKRTQKNGGRDSDIAVKSKEGLSNGFGDKDDMVNGKDGPVNGLTNVKSDNELPSVRKVNKTYPGKATNSNRDTEPSKDAIPDMPNSTNPGNRKGAKDTVFKSPVRRPSKPQTPVQTKETKDNEQAMDHPSASESKCQSESTLTKHSLDSEPAMSVPSTSTPNPLDIKPEPRVQTPPFNNPMTTPTMKKSSPEDSGSSDLKKRRGRPPGSKTKKEEEGGKPKRKYSKKKKLDMDNESEQNTPKPVKPLMKGKAEAGASVARGPVFRVQGSSIASMVSCQLVNAPDEVMKEEALIKGGKKKPKKVVKHVKRHGAIVSGHMGHAAVLAMECQSPTGLWVCALCGNPPNFGILGDLYGPYHPSGSDAPSSKQDRMSKGDHKHGGGHSRDWHHTGRDDRRASSGRDGKRNHSSDSRGQKGKALMARQAESTRSRRWRQVKTYMDEMGLSTGRRTGKRRHSEGGDGTGEIWIHEECAVWSQGVIFFQGALYGILEAVTESESKKCNLCREIGASIGCLTKGCKHVYHYLCAIEAECQMHQDNYSMTCPKHKDKKVRIRGGP